MLKDRCKLYMKAGNTRPKHKEAMSNSDVQLRYPRVG